MIVNDNLCIKQYANGSGREGNANKAKGKRARAEMARKKQLDLMGS